MIDKRAPDPAAAVAAIPDGAVVLLGGFGNVGVPMALIDALVALGRRDLTIVANNCGIGDVGVANLFKHDLVRKVIASFPAQAGNHHFLRAYNEGSVELELVPQGTLAERLHAGGAGLGGFFTPTAVASELAGGKERRVIEGRDYLFETPLRGDFALVRAHVGDRMGNLRYRLSARNFNPVMAMAAEVTIAEVERIVPVGEIGPDDVHTPSVFVDRVVEVPR